ncbi:MAG: Type 1 glutamine amidotransferase-like domain-containing protein [Verrucomicrobiales bacterium]
MNHIHRPILSTLIACALVLPGFAVDPDDRFSYWPRDLKIQGMVIATATGEIDAEIPGIFLAAAGGDSAKVAVIDLRSAAGDELPNSMLGEVEPVEAITLRPGGAPFTPSSNLAEASGILLLSDSVLGGGLRESLDKLAPELQARIQAGSVVCAIGPVASLLGDRAKNDDLGTGLGLIPSAIIDTGFSGARDRETLLNLLSQHPKCVGIGLPEGTSIVLNQRKVRCFGPGPATFMLAGNGRQPEREEQIYPSAVRGNNPYETIADLTAWRRDAIERQLPPFPAQQVPVPDVEQGSLIIVGGGGMPRGLMERMVEMAGGENARMVYVPCTEAEQVGPDNRLVRQWQSMGVESTHTFHTKDRTKADSDDTFLAPLKNATGIWFGGGRQWNFADSYFGTKAHELMHAVLERGGVIGGSSAGASIQADYLARANPVANFDIMAPGYERGLGFIEGVAIDQHFSQRGRQKDMRQLVERYPQVLGLGIDEATALVVSRSQAEIVGRGQVYFYDRRRATEAGEPYFKAYGKGTLYDLAKREVIDGGASE